MVDGITGQLAGATPYDLRNRHKSTRWPWDNGPENHSRRSQFIYRLVRWAQATQLTVELVYYPPYHSKYNPIERCWGVLEVYWNGELLDSEAAVLGFAANMTYAGRHPRVDRVSATYCSGVRRSMPRGSCWRGAWRACRACRSGR